METLAFMLKNEYNHPPSRDYITDAVGVTYTLPRESLKSS